MHQYREPLTGDLPLGSRYEPPVEGAPVASAPAAPLLTVEQGGEQLMKGMGQAERLKREEKALRSQERGVRTAEYERIMEEGGDSNEAKAEAMKALSGPLPAIRWDRFTEMNPQTVNAMIYHIRTFPALQGAENTYRRVNTEQALHAITMGFLPRPFERKLLRNVFGDEATQQMISSVPFWKKWSIRFLNVLGIPRTLLSSFDLSAPFRQGLLFGVSHPVMWGRNFAPMIKAFGSERAYESVMEEIAARPNWDYYGKAKLPFTDITSDIAHREENFMSNYAERITGDNPLMRQLAGGRNVSPVAASNRAYIAFLNKSRADYFDYMLESLQKARPELDLETKKGQEALEAIGRVVGNATGRGQVRHDTLAKAMPLMSALLFSPRLLKSRLDVIANPMYYHEVWQNPTTRREAIRQLGGLVGMISGVGGLAYLAGAKVGFDPRHPVKSMQSADFTKVRIGNTRFDIAGGFAQPYRTIAQIATGKVINSVTGETLNLGTNKFGSKNRLSVALRFLETKEAPTTGFVVDWARGTDFAKQPFSFKSEAYQRLVPLLLQDAVSFYQEGDGNAGDVAMSMALYGVGMWGIGTQTYGPKPPKPSYGSLLPVPASGGSPFGGSSRPASPFGGGASAPPSPFGG